MAKKSAARMATPRVKKNMVRLRELLRAERLCKLRQGDVLVQLLDRHQLRAIDIARQTKQRPNDLSLPDLPDVSACGGLSTCRPWGRAPMPAADITRRSTAPRSSSEQAASTGRSSARQ
jgi:hypothetical protein